MIAVGLMSGTSLDGIDAALCRITPRGNTYDVELLNFATTPFAPDVLAELHSALPPNAGSTQAVASLHHDIGLAFARAARAVAGATPVDYIASHGQTMWHDGDRHVTLQIADPFVIREALGATVCFDFRAADCAAGGHGAPLVPYVDALLLATDEEDRVAVNIGGIANLTVLPRGVKPSDVVAFDSGPGNMLIDAFVRERTNNAKRYDDGGASALAGQVDEAVLAAMLGDPYFALMPPKTTGRERFGAQFLREYDALRGLSLEDGAATLTALTTISLADAIALHAPAGARVLVSGGGAHNTAILQGLAKRLPALRVERSDAMLDPDAKEAIAFAILGYETLRERAANVPGVTGAARALQLGAIAPCRLRELIGRMETECS
ncbi:MAG: anhydro-N-acetylmuramic acid kinase [Vulcanimicrobiaceae bacterium]